MYFCNAIFAKKKVATATTSHKYKSIKYDNEKDKLLINIVLANLIVNTQKIMSINTILYSKKLPRF